MIGTHVHRVPFRNFAITVFRHIGDHLEGRGGRADIGSPAEVFLDQIVLNGALKRRDIGALFLCHRDIEGEQPWSRGIDRHGGVHLFQRDVLKKGAHVPEVTDRNPDLAHLAPGKDVIAVVPRLCRQIEGH